MMNALSPQAMGQTQLQMGQMPLAGQTPVYQMPQGQPGGPPGGGLGAGGSFPGFHNALMDWRQQRPDRPAGPFDHADWRAQRMAWMQQRPTRDSFPGGAIAPGTPPLPGAPAMQPPTGAMPVQPQMLPQQPQYPMVGSQLGVIGATPAANGFGLPGY